MTTKIENKKIEIRILRSLRKIIRAVDLHSRQLSSKYKITTPQLVALLMLVECGSLTIAELAKETELSPSTLIGIIDRLETKNFVKRKRDDKDRRKVFVSITKSGKDFLSSAPSPLQDTFSNALMNLSELEQTAIALSIDKIVELMDVQNLDAAPVLTSGAIDLEGED